MPAIRIAARYLFAAKSHNAVNIIAIIAVAGVAVAVMAMVVVLSIFNGFSDLAASHLSRLDPPLSVSRVDGRVILDGDSLADVLAARPDVSMAMPSLTRRALLSVYPQQKAVVFKAVGGDANVPPDLDSVMIDGVYAIATADGRPAMQISVGVANDMLLRPDAESDVDMYVPRRSGRINPANPAASFRGAKAVVSGVFRLEQPDIDGDMTIVPLSVGRELLEYDTEADNIEIFPAEGMDVADVKTALSARLGAEYRVLDRLEQRSEAFRMISVEKWVTFMMLVFVLVIALFNIIATLSLLVIEKRDNMRTLAALGASRAMLNRIFVYVGIIVTSIGGAIGIVLGIALALAQQYGHFIALGGDVSRMSITYYPVRVAAGDIGAVTAAVVCVAVVCGLITVFMRKR